MVHFWWLIIILAVVGVIALRRYRKTPAGALAIDRLLLRVPVMGKLNRDTSLTTLTRTLGSLVGAGVPILEALKIAGETATNALHRQAISKAASVVEKGAPLSKALGGDEVFPPIVPQMVSVGEETGKMDEVLDKVSHFFELEVEQQTKNLTSALEPIIMVVLGIMVGLLMISIILPIYSITQAF
jgi:type II secretory pathway component PulF